MGSRLGVHIGGPGFVGTPLQYLKGDLDQTTQTGIDKSSVRGGMFYTLLS